MSINLKNSALEIITNNPESATPLYDVLLFMARSGAASSAEFDETTELLYSMTADSRKHREAYEKTRSRAA